jgi:hypothetical protein
MLTLLFTMNFHMSTSKLMRSGLQFEQAQLYKVAAAVGDRLNPHALWIKSRDRQPKHCCQQWSCWRQWHQ